MKPLSDLKTKSTAPPALPFSPPPHMPWSLPPAPLTWSMCCPFMLKLMPCQWAVCSESSLPRELTYQRTLQGGGRRVKAQAGRQAVYRDVST